MAAASCTPPVSATMSSEDTKIYACVTCVQRKVKCDKLRPCTACSKSQLQCKYRSTPPPQRRKRKLETPNHTLLERLRAHEATLQRAGLPFDAFDSFDAANGGADVRIEAEADTTDNLRPRSLPPAPKESSSSVTTQRRLPHRGILVSEHGGTRYYEHGLVGSLGQEVCSTTKFLSSMSRICAKLRASTDRIR
jgi:Fungal Zn(2)-Cys(6) binuclear cluster domain